MRTIQETYEKLLNGDEYLLNILDEIIEYRVTRGAKSKQVPKIISWKDESTALLVSGLLIISAYLAAVYLYYFLSIEFGFICAIVVAILGLYIVINYFAKNKKYRSIYKDYVDVNCYVDSALSLEQLEQAYWQHHKKDKNN